MLAKHNLVVERRVGEDIVLMQQENMRFHMMNESAAVVWEAIDGSRDERQLAEVLASKYNIGVDEAISDVKEVIEALRELQLVADSAS